MNDNSGALFKNDRREHDRQPNLRGSITVDGKEYWLSGWTKTINNGGPKHGEQMISLSAQPKDARSSTGDPAPSQPAPDDAFDNDIPF